MTSGAQPADGHTRAQDVAVIELVAPDYASSTLLLDEMLADMIAAGEFMTVACETLGLNVRTIYKRLKREPALAELLDEARFAGLELRAARTASIARGGVGSSGDWKRDQLIVKQDNWLLEKLHPEQYGAKLEVKSKSLANVTISDDPIEAARQYAEWVQKT